MENIFNPEFLKIALKHFAFSYSENKIIKKIYYPSTIFEGETIYNKKTLKYEKNGIGIFTNQCGLTFFGKFENDKINGEGNIFYLNGSFLRGRFIDNKLDGMCLMQNVIGDIYILNFKNGELHGYSTFFPKNEHFSYVLLFLCNKFMNKKKKFKFENFEIYEKAKFKIIKEIFENSQISEIFYTEKDIENVLRKKKIEENSLFISSHKIGESYLYLGIFDEQLIFNGLGILINLNDCKIKIGDFFDSGMENFGIILQKKYSFFGNFKNGKLNNKILIQNFTTNEYKLCNYKEGSFNSIIKEGKGDYEDKFFFYDKNKIIIREFFKPENEIIFCQENFDISILKNFSFEFEEITLNRRVSFAPPKLMRSMTFNKGGESVVDEIRKNMEIIQKKKEKKILEIKKKKKDLAKNKGLNGVLPVLNNGENKISKYKKKI